MPKYRVRIMGDPAPENPATFGMWKVHSFSRKHVNFTDPEDLGFSMEDGTLVFSEDLQRQMDEGQAFPLSYYEHGRSLWSLGGEGPSCRFDSVRFAGLLVRVDGHTFRSKEAAAKSARLFLETYTDWCNGDVFGYHIEVAEECSHCGNTEWETVDSCYGYYGWDHVRAAIAQALQDLNIEATIPDEVSQ